MSKANGKDDEQRRRATIAIEMNEDDDDEEDERHQNGATSHKAAVQQDNLQANEATKCDDTLIAHSNEESIILLNNGADHRANRTKQNVPEGLPFFPPAAAFVSRAWAKFWKPMLLAKRSTSASVLARRNRRTSSRRRNGRVISEHNQVSSLAQRSANDYDKPATTTRGTWFASMPVSSARSSTDSSIFASSLTYSSACEQSSSSSAVSSFRRFSERCFWTLRRTRVPLAFVCFVFFFVIQFRANHYATRIMPMLSMPHAAAVARDAMHPLSSHSTSSSASSSSSSQASFTKLASNFGSNQIISEPNNDDNHNKSAIIAVRTEKSSTTTTSASTAANLLATTLPACPLIPPKLVGRLKVLRDPPPMPEMEIILGSVHVGGRFSPPHCEPKYKVAIIVPYRDREHHLRTFLWNMHPMLMRQDIDYGIYIVEQAGVDRFNRAKLFNVGFLEASKQHDYDCFIFHDVDLIPEDDRNLYTCPEQPRHMSVAIDKFRYRLPYLDLFGGVSALTRQQFETVNGFSNQFWGWGGEDDDMSNRVRHYHYNITRYSSEIARYTMLKHRQDSPNTERFKKLYSGWRRYATDGIRSTQYRVLDITFRKLYTRVLVDLLPPPVAKHSSTASAKARRHLRLPLTAYARSQKRKLHTSP